MSREILKNDEFLLTQAPKKNLLILQITPKLYPIQFKMSQGTCKILLSTAIILTFESSLPPLFIIYIFILWPINTYKYLTVVHSYKNISWREYDW